MHDPASLLPAFDDVQSVTIDLSSVGGSASTSMAPTGGPIDGQTQAYRVTQAIGAGLAVGAYELPVTITYGASSTTTVTVRLLVFTGAVQSVSAGGSIQAAINAAAPGDAVVIGNGTYTGPGNKDLTIGKAIIVTSLNGASSTTIDCQSVGRAFGLDASGETNQTVIAHLTLVNGAAGALWLSGTSPSVVECVFSNNYDVNNGGAVLATGACAPRFLGCVFTNNSTGDGASGGAVAAQNGANPTLSACTFNLNVANGYPASAGAIQLAGASGTIVGCSFADNSAYFGQTINLQGPGTWSVTGTTFTRTSSGPAATALATNGGTLAVSNSAFTNLSAGLALGGGTHTTVTGCTFQACTGTALGDNSGATVTSCQFTNNTGGAVNANGGGSYTSCTFTGNTGGNGPAVNDGGLTFTSCTFTNNASTGNGGAVDNNNNGSHYVSCIFTNNSALGSGGAIYGQPNLSGCVFTNNTAQANGGALSWEGASTVTNCLFVGNLAVSNGGAIFWDTGSSLLSDTTITGNAARLGGAIYFNSGSSSTVRDSILWANTHGGPGTSDELYVTNNANVNPTISYSDVLSGPNDIDDAGLRLNGGAGFSTGGVNHDLSADPQFLAGPRGSYYLSQTAAGQETTSPCVDAGSQTAAAAGLSGATTRADAVPDSGTVDLGYHFSTSPPPPAVAIVIASGNDQTGNVSTTLANPLTVFVSDANGLPVSGFGVTFAVTSGGGTLAATSVATDGAGLARGVLTLGASTGTNTVTATATGLTGSPITFTATATANAPTQLLLASGNAQSGTISTPLPAPLVVTVVDGGFNPVTGVQVTFAIAGGGGQLSAVTVSTNASGQASTTLTPGSIPGTNTVTATATGLLGSPVTFTAQGTSTATQVAIASGNAQMGSVSAALANPLVVVVRDAFGEPIQGYGIHFAITSGGGSLSVTDAVTNVLGQTQTALTLGSSPGANTVQAVALGLSNSPLTFTETATALPAAIAVASGNNQSGNVGTTLASPLVVTVTDTQSQPVVGYTVVFTVTGGGGSLSATSVPTDANGHAQTILTLGSTVVTNTVSATAPGLTGSPVSFTATANGNTAFQIVYASGDAQTRNIGTQLGNPFVVTVLDAGGVPVSGYTVAFNETLGTGILSASSAVTNALGQAQTTLTLGPSTGQYQVQATASLSGSPVTFGATATANAPSQIAVASGNNQLGAVSKPLANAFVANVTDAGGAPVAGVAVTFAVTGGGGSLSASNVLTDVLGNAATTLTLGAAAGTNTVTATLGGATGSPLTFTANGLVPVPQFTSATIQSRSELAAGIAKPGETVDLTVVVEDVGSNLPSYDNVSSVTIDLSSIGGAAGTTMTPFGAPLNVQTRAYRVSPTLVGGLTTGVYRLAVTATNIQPGNTATTELRLIVFTGNVTSITEGGSLQQAIDDAAPGDAIFIGDGTYTGTSNTNLTIGKAIVITSVNGSSKVTIDCQGVGRAFNLSGGETNQTVIARITIQDGAATGMRLASSSPSVVECVFDGNLNAVDGGACVVHGAGAVPQFLGCSFTGNTVENGARGGAFVAQNGATVSLVDCSFVGNTAAQGGSALYFNGASGTLTRCTVSDNPGSSQQVLLVGTGTWNATASSFIRTPAEVSSVGGVDASSYAGNLNVTGCLFSGLDANFAGASGLACASGATATIANCTFTGCSNGYALVENGGSVTACPFTSNGAGAVRHGGTSTYTGCTFTSNSSGAGGAIYDAGGLTLTSCTFTSNQSSGVGGAIYDGGIGSAYTSCSFTNDTASGSGGAIYGAPALTSCTFSGNIATGSGGALYWNGVSTVENCLFSGNTAGANGGAIYVNGSTTTALSLLDSTVAGGNNAAFGGGIYFGFGLAVVRDSIIYGNTHGGTGTSDQLFVTNSTNMTATITFCDVADGAHDIDDSGSRINPTAGFVPGSSGNIAANPQFVVGPRGASYLSQTAAGQATESPCVDAGSQSAAAAGLGALTTRTDVAGDAGTVDMGYHFAP